MTTDIYTRIRQAAYELVGEGIWPTVVEVRNRLGTGSNTTINNTLKSWRQDFLSRMALSSRRPDWPSGLAEAFEEIWQKACDAADAELATVRGEAQAEVAVLREESEQLTQRLAESDATLVSLGRELELKAGRIAELEQRLAAEEARRTAQDENLAALAASLEASRKQLGEVQREADARVGDIEARAEERVQAEKQAADKREALAYERLEGLRVRLYEQIEDERQAMKQSVKKLEDELAQQRRDSAKIDTVWRERLVERERENGRLGAKVEALDARVLELQASFDAARQDAERTGDRLLQASEQLGALRAGRQGLADRLRTVLTSALSVSLEGADESERSRRLGALLDEALSQLPETAG
ncbi:DNA-binding protein [Crenobacter sp. SG2305]|uniref:DNA-binding protein n=1 Tax=Crenobacter oryzisoli TaxID=3056844 RepID=UPI0025AA39E5|nr:DNA-binding protein [Crenobacter sp. SG2305]MDN0082932.1 DNA-binding protein [Crenobacter sp. SG2305]